MTRRMNTNVGILYHPMIAQARKLAESIEKQLSCRNVRVWKCSAWEPETACTMLDKTDLVLTTGGDGTILRASHILMGTDVPITGINLGRLGFLTELGVDEIPEKLVALIDGQGWIDERPVLQAELRESGADGNVRQFYALNDVVVARGGIARLIGIDVKINDRPFTGYRADGVIVSSATGSTGYAMAAGGPILHPRSENFMLVPVSPHLGLTQSVVLNPDDSLELQVSTSHQATISVDGHINLPLGNGAVITVRNSKKKVKFLRIHDRNAFFESLEKRLQRKR